MIVDSQAIRSLKKASCPGTDLQSLKEVTIVMKRGVFYRVLLFLTMGLCLSPAAFAGEKLALLELRAEHRIETSVAEAFSSKIREALRSFGVYDVLSIEDLEKVIKKYGLDCDDAQCLVDFGKATGIKFVITGSLSKLGSTYYVNLSLIETEGRGAGVKKEVLERYRTTEGELFKKAETIAALITGNKKIPVKASPERTKVAEKVTRPKKIRNSVGMDLVFIPAGTFIMGSPLDEPGRSDDEMQHRVSISRPFYLQATEVTQRQWKRVMGNNPSHFKDCGEDCPVESVSWFDAQNFINRLNKIEGTKKYRLPTESEWEYASRAGTLTPFNTGNCISTDQANFDGRKPLPGCADGVYRGRTVSATSFRPNDRGLYGMHGNVWEWCQDWKEPYPGDLQQRSLTKGRVLRGGSLSDSARNLRSARRFMYVPDYSDSDIGFRVVKDL
jgi:formylglycine-generating enzyme required for sulfatase activity